MSALETPPRTKVLRCGKPPETRSKQKKVDVESEGEEARLELDAENVRVSKLEACATELEKRSEHSASQVHVAETKYLFLYYEAQTLKY